MFLCPVKLTEQWSMLDREYSTEEQGLKLMLKNDNEKRIEKQKKIFLMNGKKYCLEEK